jgi:Predicted nucleoside-diphosphate sugar epimerases
MKPKTIKTYLCLLLIEGIGALAYYFAIPSETGSARFLHQSMPRLALAALFLLVLLVAAALLWQLQRRVENGTASADYFDKVLIVHDRLHLMQTIFTWTGVFAVELFFLTFVAFPPFLRPLFLWLALLCLQGWVCLRVTYADRYTPLHRILLAHWRAHSTTQRRVFWVMLLIGLVYFCTFLPLNAKGWNDPSKAFMSGVDEGIQYPIAVQTLTAGDTFASSVYHVMINESDVYGHPYVALEAAILLPSRLIFGANFGDHLALNLTLLRQFINVLPIVLALMLLVYMVTRFKSMAQSVTLYLLLLTIPGVVKFNIRFLHPDAVVLLLVILTIFFLQRDQFRYRKNFYLAAVLCSLAAVIKLWGLFFFLAVAVYLIWGLARRSLTVKRALLVGGGFLLVMLLTMLVSDPGRLVPSVAKELWAGLRGSIVNRTVGYDSSQSDVYAKDFPTWLRYFEIYYLQDYFFYFSFLCLLLSTLWGKQKLLSVLLLAWCVTILGFMVNFLAAKSYWYMMELMVPLYPVAFLLPGLAGWRKETWLAKQFERPFLPKLLWGIVLLFCGSQFVFNMITIATSPVILNYAR